MTAEQLTGRDLDAEIARRVFGQGVWRHETSRPPWLEDWCYKGTDQYIPLYSTDIAAAWRVMERMRELDREWEFEDALRDLLGIDHGQGEVTEHVRVALHRLLNGSVPTAERLCLAALRVVGRD